MNLKEWIDSEMTKGKSTAPILKVERRNWLSKPSLLSEILTLVGSTEMYGLVCFMICLNINGTSYSEFLLGLKLISDLKWISYIRFIAKIAWKMFVPRRTSEYT